MAEFNGFPRQYFTFFNQLQKNNSKEWFEKHREDYNEFVMHPAREFVAAMGNKLRKIAPEVKAIPKINQSLFKINRDVRFSKDKSPYKTYMGIWLWEGDRKRMECSGFYLHGLRKKCRMRFIRRRLLTMHIHIIKICCPCTDGLKMC